LSPAAAACGLAADCRPPSRQAAAHRGVSMAIATPESAPVVLAAGPRRRGQRVREWFIETSLLCCGLFSSVVTLTIAAVVVYGSLEFLLYHSGGRMSAAAVWERVVYFFTGAEWTAGFATARYGILPLLLGTLSVAVIASFIALPVGLTTAVYLSEYASP